MTDREDTSKVGEMERVVLRIVEQLERQLEINNRLVEKVDDLDKRLKLLADTVRGMTAMIVRMQQELTGHSHPPPLTLATFSSRIDNPAEKPLPYMGPPRIPLIGEGS